MDPLPTFVLWYCIIGGIFGAFTSKVAEAKGYTPVNWFFAGLCFNMIALVAIAGMPSKK
ncbi:MAG: hypothetical protein ACKVRP_02390 [Bacteroidota bacterium]